MQGKKSQLTDEKQAKLEEIGFAWVAPGYNASRKRRKTEEDVVEEFGEDIPVDDDVHVQEPAPFQPDFFASPHRRWLV